MRQLKAIIKKYFKYLYYFYTFLRYRMFIAIGLSLVVGTLDGFGMAMFLPLLLLVDGQNTATGEGLGDLNFLLDGLKAIGIPMTLLPMLLVILFFVVFKGLARFAEGYYKIRLVRFFSRILRFDNMDALTGYSYKAFATSDIGRLQSSLSGETGKVLAAYSSYFGALQAGVMVMIYTTLAFLTNSQFALLIVAGAVLSNLAFRQLYKLTIEVSRKLTLGGNRFQGLLIQQVAFFKYLKATGLLQTYTRKLKAIILEMEAISLKMSLYNVILSSAKEPMIVVVVICVIMAQVTWFSQSVGGIILSLLFFYRSLNFLTKLQTEWNTFLRGTGSLENMMEFMKELKAKQDKNGKERVGKFGNALELKQVDFSYNSVQVLSNISLTIRKNETIAFVGESGSGKTTLVNILTGLLAVENGRFLIDGMDSKKINMTTHQQRIGYITQEPVIFSDNIYNNVTFWAERIPENEALFWDALRKASIDKFVAGLPNKENSLLGNNGILVSGGQKQRISIARELYKKIDILIMDEATSALDSETERAIQENIDRMKGHYTILIVAHRLSTVRNADRVVLLSKGQIENVGDFESLRINSKTFERMVELQEL